MEPSSQEVNAPYWTLEPGWNTELEVRNNLAQRTLRVTPILLTASGREIPLSEVSVAPEEVVSIDLQSVVSNVEPGTVGRIGSFGSALFRFAGLDTANIFAASLVRKEGSSIEFSLRWRRDQADLRVRRNRRHLVAAKRDFQRLSGP